MFIKKYIIMLTGLFLGTITLHAQDPMKPNNGATSANSVVAVVADKLPTTPPGADPMNPASAINRSPAVAIANNGLQPVDNVLPQNDPMNPASAPKNSGAVVPTTHAILEHKNSNPPTSALTQPKL